MGPLWLPQEDKVYKTFQYCMMKLNSQLPLGKSPICFYALDGLQAYIIFQLFLGGLLERFMLLHYLSWLSREARIDVNEVTAALLTFLPWKSHMRSKTNEANISALLYRAQQSKSDGMSTFPLWISLTSQLSAPFFMHGDWWRRSFVWRVMNI